MITTASSLGVRKIIRNKLWWSSLGREEKMPGIRGIMTVGDPSVQSVADASLSLFCIILAPLTAEGFSSPIPSSK